jgi:hypothetical protein
MATRKLLDVPAPSSRSRRVRRWCLLALIIVVVAPAPAVPQDHARVDGTVQSIVDRSLTLLSDTPIVLSRPLLGIPLVSGATPRPHAGLYVDLRQLAPTEYGSIRPGDRISVAGVISDEGLIATSISLRSRSSAPSAPQSP